MSDVKDKYQIPNPFQRKALNPLRDETHEELLVYVDGFAKLENHPRASQPMEQPWIVAVVGRNGTGRSSAANIVLETARRQLNIEQRHRFLVPRLDEVDHSEFSVWQNWFVELFTLIELELKDFSAEARKDLEAEVDAVQENVMGAKLKRVALKLSQRLAALDPPASFGVCLEQVRNYDIVSSAKQIFGKVPVPVVFTVNDYEPDHSKVVVPLLSTKGLEVVNLGTLSGDDAKRVVEKAWDVCSKHDPPFEPQVVQEEFSKRSFAIGKLLEYFSMLLEFKAVSCGLPPWPDNPELKIKDEQFPKYIRLFLKKDRLSRERHDA